MPPFHLHFTLTRRQRVVELFPWLPAIAGALGFSIGAALLATVVSPWFLFLILLPIIFYRSLVVLLLELTFFPGKSVEVVVDADTLTIIAGGETRSLPLDGIIQVFREGKAWTVLHADGTAVLIPGEVVTEPEIEFLKSFARRAAAERSRTP